MQINYDNYKIKSNNTNIKKVNMQDIYMNDFDTTWAVFDGSNIPKNPITEEDFKHKIGLKTWDRLPQENFNCNHEKCDGSIVYQYNNEYFRSDDFINNHDGIHILFAGCSETEGVGGSLESTWTKRVYNEISKTNKVSGFYSIGRAGYGWQKIITNFQIYSKKYGFPEFFFVLLPNVGRQYRYNVENETYRYFQLYPEPYEIDDNGMCVFQNNEKMPILDVYKNGTILLEEYYKALIDFKISWNLFEEYCKLNKTKILWSTYDEYDTHNFCNLSISDNFFPIDVNGIHLYLDNKKEIPINKDAFKYRDGHFGTLIKEYWAHEFLKQIENRKII